MEERVSYRFFEKMIEDDIYGQLNADQCDETDKSLKDTNYQNGSKKKKNKNPK